MFMIFQEILYNLTLKKILINNFLSQNNFFLHINPYKNYKTV